MRKILSVFVIMLMSNMAFARVAVHDNAGVIPQTQQNALLAESSRWPFDLHVLTGAFGSPAAMDQAVFRCVTGPNVLCIGIDPVHHRTTVNFGTALGVPRSGYPLISSAGNSNFKAKDYQGGIEAIATRAREYVGTATIVHPTLPEQHYTTQTPVQVHIDNPVPTGMTTGWWLFLFIMVALVGVCIWAVRRAIKTAKKVNEDMNDFRDEAFEMSSRNMEERDFHQKLKTKLAGDKHPMMPVQTTTPVVSTAPVAPTQVVSKPAPTVAAPTTVVHNHYGNNNPGYNPTLTGSVVGDVLLVDALTRPTTPVVVAPAPVVVEREVVRETPSDGGSSSNWDTKSDDDNSSGSSSSSWDDSSSSSSSSSSDSDSGSSSSWDSGSSDSGSSSDWGGGSDSGSSGGDSGGGSSDW